jgi:hypothetical protein
MKSKPEMMESLMASLLTLDWEINPQTISRFEKELEGLKKKIGDDPHSKKLIDLTLPICNYLRVRKGSASPASMQFLHEATRTLHHFRKKRKLTIFEGKRTIQNLVDRFQKLLAEVDKINLTLTRATPAKSQQAARKTVVQKKSPARKPAVRKVRTPSATAEVLKAIKRYKKGVDIATLKEVTGFTDSAIRNILYRAAKEGKIKRVARGIYAAA